MSETAGHEAGNGQPDRRGLLRIGEVARRAGVARGTIQHYLREGLLPAPVKTHPNMAYYTPDTVERIRLIKELQTKSFLPLSQIRTLIGSGAPSAAASSLAETLIVAQEAALNALSPAARAGKLTPREAARQFGLRPRLLEELVKLRIATLQRDETGREVFRGVDLEVIAAIAKLKRLGLTERAGFRAKDVVMYREALEQLLEREVQTFLRVTSGLGKRARAAEIARAAVEGATLLLLAVRKKIVLDFLAMAGAEVLGRS
jgi:DNA-binding transcriptional MerR regulator